MRGELLRQPLTPEPQGAGLGALPFLRDIDRLSGIDAQPVKRRSVSADTPEDMVISEEQVRRAVEYLRTSDEYRPAPAASHRHASPELVERVATHVAEMPDVRADRIAHAMALVAGPLPDSSELAAKMLARYAADSIR